MHTFFDRKKKDTTWILSKKHFQERDFADRIFVNYHAKFNVKFAWKKKTSIGGCLINPENKTFYLIRKTTWFVKQFLSLVMSSSVDAPSLFAWGLGSIVDHLLLISRIDCVSLIKSAPSFQVKIVWRV